MAGRPRRSRALAGAGVRATGTAARHRGRGWRGGLVARVLVFSAGTTENAQAVAAASKRGRLLTTPWNRTRAVGPDDVIKRTFRLRLDGRHHGGKPRRHAGRQHGRRGRGELGGIRRGGHHVSKGVGRRRGVLAFHGNLRDGEKKQNTAVRRPKNSTRRGAADDRRTHRKIGRRSRPCRRR